jgi:hypothetical protein
MYVTYYNFCEYQKLSCPVKSTRTRKAIKRFYNQREKQSRKVYFIRDDQNKIYFVDQCFLGVRSNQTVEC